MTDAIHLQHLRRAIAVAQRSRLHANHPFGAILVDANNEVLLEAENTVNTERDCTGHAETNLVRQASQQYAPEILRQCTLYTSTEPCAMCAGAIHWGQIGRVVFALSEEQLYTNIGSHAENDTMRLPCREVFARCTHPIEVIGPLIEEEAWTVHAGFWV